jgi:ABC-type glycerol-3-phosphate transport system substrate-binding protein
VFSGDWREEIRMDTLARRGWRRLRAVAGLLALALVVTGCTVGGGDSKESKEDSKESKEVVTITLSGPNQWTTSGSSFGKAWEDLIAAFEKQEPNIKVKTTVLPLSRWAELSATQLAAGTAPELVFSQTPHRPHMVHTLDVELNKPNPYIENGPGSEKWIDVFREEYLGWEGTRNAEGKLEFVPFNLVGIGMFYNKEAFAKAGVQAPFEDFEAFIDGCDKLRAAGYTPHGMEASELGIGVTIPWISGMLLEKYADRLNVYDSDGSPGKAPTITQKSITAAVLGGELTSKTPEVTESLKLVKRMFEHCVDENWRDSTPALQASVVDLANFAAGKVAMTGAANLGLASLQDVPFEVGGLPYPIITTETSPLAVSGEPEWLGARPNGTSYMIPSTTEGEKLQAAIKFLQYLSSPQHVEPWLSATGGIPAVKGVEGSPATKSFELGQPRFFILMPPMVGPPGVTQLALFDGYLIGTKSLEEQQVYLQDMWTKAARQGVKDNKWGDEPWAKGSG